jgi:hypothetical protein
LVPVITTSLLPPAGPLVGEMAVTTGADGSVPAGADVDVAGLASLDDATVVVLLAMMDGVTLEEVTTPFTVTVPLVNGVPLLVQEICWPLGAAHTQPVPDALTGRTPAGKVTVTVTGWFSAGPLELATIL